MAPRTSQVRRQHEGRAARRRHVVFHRSRSARGGLSRRVGSPAGLPRRRAARDGIRRQGDSRAVLAVASRVSARREPGDRGAAARAGAPRAASRSRSTASRTRIFRTATNSRPRPTSRSRLARGQAYLEHLLGTKIRVFVPPHNALSKRGLRAVERGRAQPARIVPVVPSVDASVGTAHARQLVARARSIAPPPIARRAIA